MLNLKYLVFTFIVLVNCTSIKTHEILKPERFPAAFKTVIPDPKFSLTCSEFFNLINRYKPNTILKTLQLVKLIRPNFLSQHTFVYNSRSLHESSFEYPRALVFGGNAELILSFNGEPNQGAYEELEIMCFQRPQNNFEFYEITFPLESNKKSDLSNISEEERKLPFVISPKNGHPTRRCTTCHESPAHPLMDTYSLWPGFYGSNDDGVTYFMHGSEFDESAEVEQRLWTKFSQNQLHLGRYDVLPQRTLLASERPNLQLGRLLNLLNGSRISRDLFTKRNQSRQFKYQFANLLSCDSPELVTLKVDEIGNEVQVLRSINTTEERVLRSNISYYENKLKQVTTDLGREAKIEFKFLKSAQKIASHYQLQDLNEHQLVGLSGVISEDIYLISKFQNFLSTLGMSVSGWGLPPSHELAFSNGRYYSSRGIYPLRTMLEASFAADFFGDESEIVALYRSLEDDDDHQENRKRLCQVLKAKQNQ